MTPAPIPDSAINTLPAHLAKVCEKYNSIWPTWLPVGVVPDVALQHDLSHPIAPLRAKVRSLEGYGFTVVVTGNENYLIVPPGGKQETEEDGGQGTDINPVQPKPPEEVRLTAEELDL